MSGYVANQAPSAASGAMDFSTWMAQHRDNSFMREMTVDPEAERCAPNHDKREVKSGHYVPVLPTPLPQPHLVLHSPELAAELELSEDHCASSEFTSFFSGDMSAVPGSGGWATPYALSIYGDFLQNQQCPFRNGHGYGDGRAMSVQELVTSGGARWELQLKGGGRTPFCRGADGRAVLRSSIREFLVSEAMHHLGVGTTRALSLVVSRQESAQRAAPEATAGRSVQTEPCAITCRVATSFLRIGHFELFGRRAAALKTRNSDDASCQGIWSKVTITRPGKGSDPVFDFGALPTASVQELKGVIFKAGLGLQVGGCAEKQELVALAEQAVRTLDAPVAQSLSSLEMLVDHALDREFGGAQTHGSTSQERANSFLRHAAERVATMTAQWLRVGFCQGNFNSDNCLISGRTMDYGPFGYIEEFDPRFGTWTGSGAHYAFMNQPKAGMMNIKSLTEALTPLLNVDEDDAWDAARGIYEQASAEAQADMFRQKLGLREWSSDAAGLLSDLLRLMENGSADWTITWRELAGCIEVPVGSDDALILAPLLRVASNAAAINSARDQWIQWIKRWMVLIDAAGGGSREASAKSMRLVSPKYVPREWMLKEAYDSAGQGDFTLVKELFNVFKTPFAEQPAHETKYYVCKPKVRIS